MLQPDYSKLFASCLKKLMNFNQTQKIRFSQVPVSPTCNFSYSGGRNQEDNGLKPALGK
jgi:hypothetical protein